jgi:O-methyltransferase
MEAQQDYLSILREERLRLINTLRETKFSQLDPNISHRQIIPLATYAPWDDDKEFREVHKIILDHTLVDIYRCYELWSIVKQMRELDGDILEIGVWRGGTAGVIAASNKKGRGTLFLADTFSGVVKAGEDDTLYRGGEHADTTKETVIGLLDKLDVKNYELLTGIFPDDFSNFASTAIKLCHIDVDTFLSAKDIVDFVWPRITKGGAIVFDDYGFFGCEGITKFVNQLHLKDAIFIYNLNGHGLLIKN